MPQTVGLGVVGLGKIGRLHALNVSGAIRGARLVAVCDSDPDTLAGATDEFEVAGCSTVQQLVEHADVEGIVVASTAETHAEVIATAARAGKHIFSEKPVSLGLEATDAALQQVVDAGLVFQIGFQRRWDAAFLEARRQISAGAIGRPLLFKAHGRDPQFTGAMQDPAKSGGIFLDAAMHDYDAGRFLMGAEIVRVAAHGATLLHEHLTPLGDIDTSATILTFESGALGITEWNRISSYGYDVRAEVHGSEGSLQIGAVQHTAVLVLSAAGVTHDTVPWFAERFGDAYRAELEGFAAAIVNRRQATPGIEDARNALHVALLARESFRTGRTLAVPALPPLVRRAAPAT